MKNMLAVFFCVFSAVAVNGQEPTPKAEAQPMLKAEPLPESTVVQQEPIQQVIQEPCQRCASNANCYPPNCLYRWAITG
jgi:hypothetical protein